LHAAGTALLNMKVPSFPETVLRVAPVLGFLITTVASGTAAPSGYEKSVPQSGWRHCGEHAIHPQFMALQPNAPRAGDHFKLDQIVPADIGRGRHYWQFRETVPPIWAVRHAGSRAVAWDVGAAEPISRS